MVAAGFVGSRVTEEAVKTGLSVVSISRRGQPPPGVTAPWTSQVEWARVGTGFKGHYRFEINHDMCAVLLAAGAAA